MLLAPKWSKLTKMHKILNKKQVSKLEQLRQELNFPHETFCFVVSASSEFGKIIIEMDYQYLKKKYPHAPEKEVLAELLNYENDAMRASGSTEEMTEDQIKIAMNSINNFDDLCNFIIGLEHKEQPQYYSNPVGSQIESIIRTNKSTA